MPSTTETAAERKARLRKAGQNAIAKGKAKSGNKPANPTTKAQNTPKQPQPMREAKAVKDAQLTKQLLALLAKGKSLTDCAEELGRPAGKLAMLRMIADVAPADQISGSLVQIQKGVVQARDKQNQSWGQITARTRDEDGNVLAESRVKSMYEEATGTSTLGLRNGRGGRLPSDPKVAKTVKRPEPKEKASGARARRQAEGKAAAVAAKGKPVENKPRARRTGVKTVK